MASSPSSGSYRSFIMISPFMGAIMGELLLHPHRSFIMHHSRYVILLVKLNYLNHQRKKRTKKEKEKINLATNQGGGWLHPLHQDHNVCSSCITSRFRYQFNETKVIKPPKKKEDFSKTGVFLISVV